MRSSVLIGIAFCAILAGCDDAALMRKFTPPEEESIARGYVELLQQGKFDELKRDFDTSLVDSNLPDTLSEMAALFPPERPDSVKVVGMHTFRAQEISKMDISLEYHFPSKWLLVGVASQKNGDIRSIVGFHVTPIADSLENLNRFTLTGKGTSQYLMLLCGISSIGFSLYVFVLCVREKNLKVKWLWLIVVLVGIGKLAVNWTTGELTFQLIAIQIPCSSMTRPLYGPWTVAASLPAGALAFLRHRWKLKVAGESVSPSVSA